MMEKKMFYKAGPLIFENARLLRSNMTNAETKLWEFLRTKPGGFKWKVARKRFWPQHGGAITIRREPSKEKS